MKIAPSYISKERLLKKIAKRSNERIAEHTVVSGAYKPEESKMIKENLDPIARYANRHRIDLEFEPNLDKAGTSKMNIYKRALRFTEIYGESNPIPYLYKDYAGTVIIPNSTETKSEFLKNIRENAAKILYEQK